ncbi:cytochrome P450 [Aspergillus filifer]
MGNLKLSESGALHGLACFLTLNIGYWLGLFGSITLYRAFFHRLRSFPGPPLAKISALWSVGRNLKTDFNFHGPREISINNADAVRDIHGPGTVCNKGPWYDNTYPARLLQTTRDKVWHAQRRRVWDRGFATKAIGQYMPRIRENCENLISQLKKRAGTPVNASLWMSYFGFDVMGDLTFRKSFNMLKEGANAPILDRYVKSFGVGRCAPWIFLLLNNLPIISRTRQGFIDWSIAQVRERRALGQSRIDLFTYILGDGAEETKTKLVQEELDALVNQCGGGQPSYQMLSEAPLLNGCINEALRLYPPVQGGVQRLTPPNGAMIAGRFIPGDTIISTPTYSLHRDPRSFPNPNAFIPTRWTPSSNLTTRKEAFNPFMIGSFSCVGKPLAWLELRMAVSELLLTFNFRFSEEKSTEEIETLFDGLPDYFTAHAPDLELVFEVR